MDNMNPPQPQGPFRPLGTARGKGTIALAAVMMFLAGTGVICRCVSRRINRTDSGWDEYMLVIALVRKRSFPSRQGSLTDLIKFFYYTASVQTCLRKISPGSCDLRRDD